MWRCLPASLINDGRGIHEGDAWPFNFVIRPRMPQSTGDLVSRPVPPAERSGAAAHRLALDMLEPIRARLRPSVLQERDQGSGDRNHLKRGRAGRRSTCSGGTVFQKSCGSATRTSSAVMWQLASGPTNRQGRRGTHASRSAERGRCDSFLLVRRCPSCTRAERCSMKPYSFTTGRVGQGNRSGRHSDLTGVHIGTILPVVERVNVANSNPARHG